MENSKSEMSKQKIIVTRTEKHLAQPYRFEDNDSYMFPITLLNKSYFLIKDIELHSVRLLNTKFKCLKFISNQIEFDDVFGCHDILIFTKE